MCWMRGKKRGGGEGSEGLPLSGGYALLSLSKPFWDFPFFYFLLFFAFTENE